MSVSLPQLCSHYPAIMRDDLPGQVTRGIAYEIKEQPDNIVGSPPMSHRHRCCYKLIKCLALFRSCRGPALTSKISAAVPTGRDDITSYAVLGVFDCNLARKSDDR